MNQLDLYYIINDFINPDYKGKFTLTIIKDDFKIFIGGEITKGVFKIFIGGEEYVLDESVYKKILEEYDKQYKEKEDQEKQIEEAEEEDTSNDSIIAELIVLSGVSKVLTSKEIKDNLIKKQALISSLNTISKKQIIELNRIKELDIEDKIQVKEVTDTYLSKEVEDETMRREAKKLVGILVAYTPIRTGKLRRGWKAQVSGKNIKAENKVKYAKYVNDGTKKQRAQRFVQRGRAEYARDSLISKNIEKNHLSIKYK